MSVTPVALMRGASIGYGSAPVLHEVNFQLEAGEVVAVLGPNGSGKSTLVKGLLGLAELVAGSVELYGEPAARFAQRARVGYVPQRLSTGGSLPATVAEVVESGRLARRARFRPLGSTDRFAIRQALVRVGLQGVEPAPVATLSGGQQRRVLIARALAGQPELLMMDEPMAGVDTATQDSLALTLTDLVEGGMSMLLVAHELGPVERLARRVVWVRDGRIVFDGPREAAAQAFAAQLSPDPRSAVFAERDPAHHDEAPPPRGLGLTG